MRDIVKLQSNYYFIFPVVGFYPCLSRLRELNYIVVAGVKFTS